MEDLLDKLMEICPTQSEASATHYLHSIVFDKRIEVAASFYAGEKFDRQLGYLKAAGIPQDEIERLEHISGRKPRTRGLQTMHIQKEL